MNKFLFLLLSVCLIFGSGCTSSEKKRNTAISRGVYSAQEAIRKGRVDLAVQYLNETTRIVAPPKYKNNIKSFSVPTSGAAHLKNVDYVVLPPELVNRPVIIEDSKEYKEILVANKELAKQVESEKKKVEAFKGEVDNTIRAVQNEATKEKKKGFWGWILAAVSSFGLIGIVLVAIFFPAALPIILSVAQSVFSFILNWFKTILGIIGGYFKK